MDIQTGRIVYIDDITEMTPRMILNYINEGFAPVARTVTSNVVSLAFASYKDVAGAYQVGIGEATYVSTALDTKFTASV